MDMVHQADFSLGGIKFLKSLHKNHLNAFVNLMLKKGAFAGYKIMGNRVVMVNDATALKYIFMDNYKGFHKSKYNDVLKPVLGGGIFLSEDDTWWHQRQEAAPVFASGNFNEMTDQMVAAAQSMFKRWDKKIEKGEPVDVNLETMWYALDVALRSFFHQERPDIAVGIQENLGNMLREAETRIWSFATLPQRWILKLPKYKNSLKFLNDIVTELIEERKVSNVYPDDLLSRAIKACDESPAARKILQDKVMSYLTSAHETTANAMAWAWYELGHRADIYKKLEREVDEVLGNEPPTFTTIKKMDYTRKIFDEAMRLYPPVWTMSRVALSDMELPLDDGSKLAVKEGDTLMLSPYVVHRKESYWPNPMAFDPERFTAEAVKDRPKFSYFPFGGGARLCLGFRFAQIEAAVIMAMMVQKYDLALVPGQNIVPEPMITLRPSNPIWFNIRLREGKEVLTDMPSVPVEIIAQEKCPYGHSAAA